MQTRVPPVLEIDSMAIRRSYKVTTRAMLLVLSGFNFLDSPGVSNQFFNLNSELFDIPIILTTYFS